MSRELVHLSHYQLRKKIHHGTHAEVHLAWDETSNKEVVIKLFNASFPDHQQGQQLKKKFKKEAEILRRLKHPNIVCLIEVNFEEDIRPYFVMEYAPGKTLDHKVPPGTWLSPQTICSYTHQLACALAYAHQHGITHCDLKPSNVLLAEDGHLLLSDFGIARLRESTLPDLTRYPFGTPLYRAPEQFKGRWNEKATDQYALAILVYTWFCGQTPFTETDDRSREHFPDTPIPIPSLQEMCAKKRKDIPNEILGNVERIIEKALATDPEMRFPSVQEFAKVLEEALQPLLPKPEEQKQDGTEDLKRDNLSIWRSWLGYLVLVGLLILPLVGGTWWWSTTHQNGPIDPSDASYAVHLIQEYCNAMEKQDYTTAYNYLAPTSTSLPWSSRTYLGDLNTFTQKARQADRQGRIIGCIVKSGVKTPDSYSCLDTPCFETNYQFTVEVKRVHATYLITIITSASTSASPNPSIYDIDKL